PITSDALQPTFAGSLFGLDDAFVTKLDPSLAGTAALIYSSYLGGPLADKGHAIAVDPCGTFAYIAGQSFDPGFAGTPDALIARMQLSSGCIALTGLPIRPAKGHTFTSPVAIFTDSDPAMTADNFTATIDWGDGTLPTPAVGIVQPGGPGAPFKVFGTHRY